MTRLSFLSILFAPLAAAFNFKKKKKDPPIKISVQELRAVRYSLQARDVEPFDDGYFRVYIHPSIMIDTAVIINGVMLADTTIINEDASSFLYVGGCRILQNKHTQGAFMEGKNGGSYILKNVLGQPLKRHFPELAPNYLNKTTFSRGIPFRG